MKMEKKEKKRSIFGKVLVVVLTVLALMGLAAMVLSVINAYVSPKNFIWTTVFGVAFWEIFFFNVVVLALLLILWSNKVWIAVLTMIVAIPGLCKSYSFGSKVECDNSIRIMTYNVHNFKHVDGKTEKEQFANQVMDMVRDQGPDILCCQEFTGFKTEVSRTQCIYDFADGAGFQYVYFNKKRNYGGNVIFSKYPIVKVDEDSGFGHENTYGVMVEVDAGEKGKFNVANVHLLSYAITDDEIDILMNSSERSDNFDTIGKSVLHKLRFGFQRRSEELQDVLNGIPIVESPVIICGDFNEPPLSYNYRQMQKAGFVDTFIKVGHGIKPTYAGRLPLLRIDYIWADAAVTPLKFERYRYKASDHYPLILDFAIQ